ncbi:hypothetical protein ACFWYW_37605 [Nonomuraea sp. NPDC059023]|uniref:hypothetical protein n=1 Tax=unclassified Nonomuraea TaxID=2593643 RepID=UPI0036C46141
MVTAASVVTPAVVVVAAVVTLVNVQEFKRVAGLSFLGLGAAVHALLWPADPSIVYWWAIPPAAGGVLRFPHLAEHDRRGAWSMVVAVNRYGPIIRGTAPAEPFWRVSGCWLGSRRSGPWSRPARISGAAV